MRLPGTGFVPLLCEFPIFFVVCSFVCPLPSLVSRPCHLFGPPGLLWLLSPVVARFWPVVTVPSFCSLLPSILCGVLRFFGCRGWPSSVAS